MLYFFSIGIFECWFLAALLFFKKNKTISDNILCSTFLIIGINILFSYLESYNHDHNFAFPWLINISSPFVMLHGPLLWAYCKSLTVPQFRFRPIHTLHLLPYLILLTYHYFAFYSHTAADRIEMARSESFASTFLYNFLLACMIITIFTYLVKCIQIVRVHEKRIMDVFSNTEKIDLNWLKMIFFGALLTYIITYTIILSNEFYHFTTFKFSEAIGYCLATVLISILGFYGIKQTQIFTSYNSAFYAIIQNNHSFPDQDPAKKAIAEKIKEVMENDKPYRDANLTLKKLSELTKCSESEVSSSLNNLFQKNFFDYINSYRIEEFKKELFNSQNKNLTLLGIAFSCGFNSKATFNRVFKRYTGLTPKAYKEKRESETSFPEK